MTEIRFYHLQTQDTAQALPLILTKALAGDHRIVVRAANDKDVEKLNEQLWVFRSESFLPHGSKKDGHSEDQPIWLTDIDENPNKADVLILTGGTSSEQVSDYNLCCEMFDGRNEDAVIATRKKWKTYKESGFEATYWQQNEKGGWDKK